VSNIRTFVDKIFAMNREFLFAILSTQIGHPECSWICSVGYNDKQICRKIACNCNCKLNWNGTGDLKCCSCLNLINLQLQLQFSQPSRVSIEVSVPPTHGGIAFAQNNNLQLMITGFKGLSQIFQILDLLIGHLESDSI